jgi:hypothetical protein
MCTCTNTTLWLKLSYDRESDALPYIRIVIPLQTKHTIHVAEFMIHMFVASFTFRIVPFTFCIDIQLASHIYHLMYQEYMLCVVATFTFWKWMCRIKPEHNTTKMFDDHEKFIGVWRLLQLHS